jgi:hypothetical protein
MNSSRCIEEPAASESLKVLKSKVAEKELPQRIFLFSPTFRPSDAATALPLRSTFDVERSTFDVRRACGV